MSVTGIVLAAGEGTRMGGTKQLVDLDGTPMLATTVGVALASRLDRVIVVLGHDADEVAPVVPVGADVVVNPQYRRGNLTSFRCGVEATGDVPVMLLLGDMPTMTTSIIDTCLATFGREEPWALVASYRDGIGHPYVFSVPAVTRSHDYEGRKALYRMIREQTAGRVRYLDFDWDRPRDLNTPEDVAAHLGRETS